MWYFAWVLGLGFAVGVAVLNGIWHEFRTDPQSDRTIASTPGQQEPDDVSSRGVARP